MPYVFIHGLGQTASSWNETIKYMKIDNMSFCPDLFGMLKDKEVNYQNLYQGFTEYCSQFSEPVHICGLSLGGILALQYAVEYKSEVKSLVLIGTQYTMPKNLISFQNLIFRFMPEFMFKEIGAGKKDLINLSDSMKKLDFSSRLKNINCPVMVICGKRDNANKKASISLSKIISRAEFSSIEKSGHEVNLQAPERLAEVLNSFYDKIF